MMIDTVGNKMISNIVKMIRNTMNSIEEDNFRTLNLNLGFKSGSDNFNRLAIPLDNIKCDSTDEEIEEMFYFDGGFIYIENSMFDASDIFTAFIAF